MSPIDKTLATIQAECISIKHITGSPGMRLEGVLDTILDMIDVLAGELRVHRTLLNPPEYTDETD